jgi:hypothetical protein
MSARLCPVCGDAVNARATGRPPRFCSTYCRNKAAGLRHHTRRNRASAQELRALAQEIRAGQRYGYNTEHLERQAAYAESHAERMLAEIGEATMEGEDATPVHTVVGSSGNPRLACGEKHSSGTPERP